MNNNNASVSYFYGSNSDEPFFSGTEIYDENFDLPTLATPQQTLATLHASQNAFPTIANTRTNNHDSQYIRITNETRDSANTNYISGNDNITNVGPQNLSTHNLTLLIILKETQFNLTNSKNNIILFAHHHDITREGNDGDKKYFFAGVDDISLSQLQIPSPSPRCVAN